MPGKHAGCMYNQARHHSCASLYICRQLSSPSWVSLLAMMCKCCQDHIFSVPRAIECGKQSAAGDRQGGKFGGWAASISFYINTSFAKNWANQNFLLFSISPALVVAVPEYYVADHRHEPNIHEEVQRGKEGNFLNNTLYLVKQWIPYFGWGRVISKVSSFWVLFSFFPASPTEGSSPRKGAPSTASCPCTSQCVEYKSKSIQKHFWATRYHRMHSTQGSKHCVRYGPCSRRQW